MRGLCANPPLRGSGKRRLAFFSPLPPVKSGISDYSVALLDVLVKDYDVDVFIDDGYEPSVTFGDAVRVFRHWEFHARRDDYANVVYQVGNNVFHTYMFDYIRPSPVERAHIRAKLGFGDADFVFGVFGMAKYTLGSRVKSVGFVPMSDFDDYIHAVDACLNLRKFSNGETSGTLCRALAAGKLVIVNDSGSFSQIPSDVCLKLPAAEDMTEEQEIRAISNAMRKCVRESEWVKSTGGKARAFAESALSLEKTARDYRDFIEKPICRGFTTGVVKAMVRTLKNGDEFERTAGLEKLCETILWARGE